MADFEANINISGGIGGGSAFAGGVPPSSPSSPLLINNPQLNLMASYLREINAGTHGMGAQMERAMSGMGIKFNLAGILKQSQLFTGVIGSVFQILGAAVDIILAAFMPILIPAIRSLASMLPPIRAYVERYLGAGVEWLVKIWQWISGDKTQEGIRTTLDSFTPDWLPFKDMALNWLSEWKNLGILAIAFALRGKVGKLLLNVGSVATTLTSWVLAGPRWIGKLLGLSENFKWLTKYVLGDVIGEGFRSFAKTNLWQGLKTGLEPILKVAKWFGEIGSSAFRTFFKIPPAVGSVVSVADDVVELAAKAVSAGGLAKVVNPFLPGRKALDAIHKGERLGDRLGPAAAISMSGTNANKVAKTLTPQGMEALFMQALRSAAPGSKVGSKAVAKGLLPLVSAMIIFSEAVGDTKRNYDQMRESGANMFMSGMLASGTAAAGIINSLIAVPLPMVGWGTSELTNYLENQMFNILKGPTGANRSVFDYTDVGAVKSIYLSFTSPTGDQIQEIVDGSTIMDTFITDTSFGRNSDVIPTGT